MNPLPALFVSHGAPTFAREPGRAGPLLSALGQALPHPAAVLVVSPHWTTPNPRVATTPRPRTVHDFGGFDPALYEIEYPVAGHPELADRTVRLLRDAGWAAEPDAQRGLDHGAWVPLSYLYPAGDVPVFQVSMPARLDAGSSFAFGRALAPLAGEGVLIVGSGTLTHNLHEFRIGGPAARYAAEFAAWVRGAVAEGDLARLLETLETAPHARRAHPSPDHFWPLLVAAGAAPALQPSTVLDGGIDHGVLAMDAYLFGEALSLPVTADAPTGAAA